MIGIKNLKFSSYNNEKDNQYKLDKKYPNPKEYPYKKNTFKFLSLFFRRIINNKLNAKKFIIQKLYGGRLKEINTPIKKIYKLCK